MIRRTLLLGAVMLLGSWQDSPKGPEPALLAAANDVSRVWGATTTADCRALIDETFAPEAELYLTTEELGGVVSRKALLGMADQLDTTPGLDRRWETDEATWFVGKELAVRKAHERLHEAGSTRTVLTTHVFARKNGAWTLVHSHHSSYDPSKGR